MKARACVLAILAGILVGQTAPPKDLVLTVGRGELVRFNNEVTRVAVSEPKTADAVVVSPHEVMINAKAVGKSTVVIWQDAESNPARFEVDVKADVVDLQSLQQKLDGIQVSGNEDTLVLTGSVKDVGQSKQAEALASTHAKKVVNLLQVAPTPEPRQILLQVKFASVDRVGLSELGFNYFSTNSTTIGGTTTQQFQAPRFGPLQLEGGQVGNQTVNFADLLNLFVFRPDLNIGATIRALQSKNLLQILAEPNLVVIEGKDASFLAGGEFPFPAIQASTTGGALSPVVTVQFRKFGIELSFTPTITPQGSIDLKVEPSVSSLDFANAVTLQGFLIPAISNRKASTEVILKDGESFAIAGLIDNRVIQTLSRIRGLGDIPIVGNLFRSRSTRKSTDELLVVVTPRFVRALGPNEKIPALDMPEAFLPTVADQKAAKDKAKKNDKQPEFVGPRGHQEPSR